MSGFTKLEEAALHAIFAEIPEFTAELEHQFEKAAVVERENDGRGFYTTIHVAEGASRLDCPGILGLVTHARVDGLINGLGFALIMKDGRLHLLDGYAVGPEDTTPLNFEDVGFEIVQGWCRLGDSNPRPHHYE
jgi:hypothetical protein